MLGSPLLLLLLLLLFLLLPVGRFVGSRRRLLRSLSLLKRPSFGLRHLWSSRLLWWCR